MENRIFLNRYRLSLGRNGLPVELHRTPVGITYRAHEIESGREVAIELIPAPSADPATGESLHDEACAAGQINHLNIPVLHDFGVEEDQLIYVTEYLDGPTAQAWVAARGPLPTGAVLRIAIQVVDALGAAGFHRLTHRALNPGNIVFLAGQTAKGDWPAIKLLHWLGPAVDLAANEAGDGPLDAAARYASPEQLRGEKVDFSSAIYSLGCTMWFLLTGAPPAPASPVPWEKTTRSGGEKLRGLPKIVRHLLGRMLRFDPAERPQDPIALSAYLQTCLARVERREKIERRFGIPVVATPRVVKQRTRRAVPLKPLALAALLLALATAAALLLPGRWHGRRSAPVAQKINLNSTKPPNEVAVAMKNSPGTTDRRAQPPAVPPPASVVVANHAMDEIPRDEMADHNEVVSTTTAEPPPPEEGPAVSPEISHPKALVSQPASTPAETALPKAPDTETTKAAPIIAETNESLADGPSPIPASAVPPASGDQLAAAISPTPESAERGAVKQSASRKKTEAIAKRSRSRSNDRRGARLAHTTKRAEPLPKLRVGSAPAELIGTTSDGRWILSVSESGRRIIVPPPPGYGQ
jgi:protein kinase-like protein